MYSYLNSSTCVVISLRKRSCLGELLEPEIQVDNLVGSQKSKFDDHIWNFASKVSTWMRLKKKIK